jgi:biopolymer transport protein ExbD
MAGGGGGTEELNLVPYLDVMVNLIVFMITITAYIVQMKESPVLVPSYGPGGGAAGTQKPFLTVAITQGGYEVLGGGSAEGRLGGIPKKGGAYDTRALTAAVKQVKASIPDLSDNIVLTPDRAVKYSDVVLTMDAVRFDGTAEKVLFNGVSFGLAVQ